MEQLFSAWDSIEPLVTHLTPLEISNLAFVNNEILTFIHLYFKRIRKKCKQNIIFHFPKEGNHQIYSYSQPLKMKNVVHSPSTHWEPVSLNTLKGKMIKIHKSSGENCRFIGHASKEYKKETTLILQIQKIKNDGGAFTIYGWILSGKNVLYMKMNNQKKFRPYPFWSVINSQNAHNYTLVPHSYKKIEPSYEMIYHGI